MKNERLLQQLAFIREIDALKHVFRQTILLDRSRQENDAEHSWHLAMMAMLLAEHAEEDVDVAHVMKLVLIHDLVEIDAGDTFCYDTEGMRDQHEREKKAAERLFFLLPEEQAEMLMTLWLEFEAKETPEAKFATSVDRLQPLMHNVFTEGFAWQQHGIHVDQVIERNRHIADGSPALWEIAEGWIRDAAEKGWLKTG
jgi:putative hydrolase of HD superfamily